MNGTTLVDTNSALSMLMEQLNMTKQKLHTTISNFALSGQKLWNDLPNSIKHCISVSSFKIILINNMLYKF